MQRAEAAAPQCKEDHRASDTVSNTRSNPQNLPPISNPWTQFWFSPSDSLRRVQARCISDVKADTDHTSFITGTLSLREENEVFYPCFKFWNEFGDSNSDLDLIELELTRCIWFGSLRMEPNWFVRACFRTPMRSGTFRPVHSTSVFSLLFIPLVICSYFCVLIFHLCMYLYVHCYIANDYQYCSSWLLQSQHLNG